MRDDKQPSAESSRGLVDGLQVAGEGPKEKVRSIPTLSRRQFISTSTSAWAGFALGGCCSIPKGPVSWPAADLIVDRHKIRVDGRASTAVTLNGSVPGPTLRFAEGDDAILRVQNRLDVDSSIHWHGMILPPSMDGVPGVSFRGIAPGETFTYRFPINQNGTYWYHSHSGFQEQLGMFGALIIDPREPEPYRWDEEHVILLSDWTFEDPMRILARLKKSSGYYNFQKPTVVRDGMAAIASNRASWGAMRMDPTDISDVTGATYTYLMNGKGPESNWTGLFKHGQTLRLRIVNASAASYFDFRIPGLSMTVIQADGQNVEPVTVDEIRVATAETYDVLVTPKGDDAYTVFAETMDRSGFARGTLATEQGLVASVPSQRVRPLLSMKHMGMGGMATMAGMSMGGEAPDSGKGMKPMNGISEGDGHSSSHQMGAKEMGEMKGTPDSRAWARPVEHGSDNHGPSNTRIAQITRGRLDEPGVGLEDAPHRVLVYSDLRALVPAEDQRDHEREIEMHLTGNMERYIWGFDGKKYSEASEPIPFQLGERLRITFVNDTMMNHPIHLHGMWMELVNGAGKHKPRKHTVNIKPAERVSVDINVDAPGFWAMHCHILYHMETGMFRVVEVASLDPESSELKRV